MKIENPAAFRFIMQDEIYLLHTDKTEQPALLTNPVLETKIADFNYLGKHKKGFLIVAHYPNDEFMAAAHTVALENILKRMDYQIDDVAIFNRFNYADVDFEQLQAYFKPQKLLILGRDAMPGNAPVLAFNQPEKVKGYNALFTFSFDEMMDNTANKKAFWDQMKNL